MKKSYLLIYTACFAVFALIGCNNFFSLTPESKKAEMIAYRATYKITEAEWILNVGDTAQIGLEREKIWITANTLKNGQIRLKFKSEK